MEILTANLLVTAGTVAFVHVLAGPDHILPFVMLAQAQGWTKRKTVLITFGCGVGHVLSSLFLGLLGLGFGTGLGHLVALEEVRGSLAAWLLVVFGVTYAAWGLRRSLVSHRKLAPHNHNGSIHIHSHGNVPHSHGELASSAVTFWTLFIIFVFGPCEPLIPLFMVPASRGRWDVAAAMGLVFSLVTVVTMVAAVLVVREGFTKLPLGKMERWSHALAGSVIAFSGLAVIFLGL